ncbi:MAG TPA: hypothetical protein PLK90_08065 [Clostridiales bacterium]|nr:hypothetical protein [Clostridiales bacterium]HQP70338.1 hypothetical protein [Clostridiales bacterium]
MKAEELKKNLFIKYSDKLFLVTGREFISSGGMKTGVRINLFDINSGETSEHVFALTDELEQFRLFEKTMKLISRTESVLVFEDSENFEQLEMPVSMTGISADFLTENTTAKVSFYSDIAMVADLPATEIFSVDSTEDTEKDPSNFSYTKEAVLSNGRKITVPAFIKNGENVKVFTETGEYVSREN